MVNPSDYKLLMDWLSQLNPLIKDQLTASNWAAVYKALRGEFETARMTGQFTELLLSAGIDPTPELLNGGNTEVPLGYMYRVEGLDTVTIPEGITYIGRRAFQESDIRHINLPTTLQTIGWDALFKCSKLSAIQLPNGLVKVEVGTFKSTGLESILWPGSCKQVPRDCFKDCHNLKSAKLEEGVQFLTCSAFTNCSNLIHLELPSTLQRLGECYELTPDIKEIKFNDTVVRWKQIMKSARGFPRNIPIHCTDGDLIS